jgi:deazaflavin-dependent oxidoreductase (nitroreductase family)
MLYGAEHVRRYQETGGEEGHDWRRGTTTLLLTTRGHRTGVERTSPLIYREDGPGRYVVVASKGGAPEHPVWFKNLQANPEATVQVKAERFRARAHTAEGEERERLWNAMSEVWPDYDDYQTKTDREIPVVVLERVQ